MPGLYLATNLAVLPPLVRTTMMVAWDEFAVLTAAEAKLSSGLMGMGAFAAILLKTSE